MNITKCDICKRQIKDYNQEVRATPPGKLSAFAFCLDCGKPIVRFLEKNFLVEKPSKTKKSK